MLLAVLLHRTRLHWDVAIARPSGVRQKIHRNESDPLGQKCSSTRRLHNRDRAHRFADYRFCTRDMVALS